jgi:spermidine synthase
MRIGGVSQSGGLVLTIWKKAITETKNLKLEIKNCLILGLGAGGSALLVDKKWPGIKIVGVEIDPLVVGIGQKYFKLEQVSNLKIEITDAFKKKFETPFDLILVDLYLGQSFPAQAEQKEFLEKIKKISKDKGVVIFNRFYWGKYKKQARNFEKILKNYFPKVWSKKTVSNLLIFCSH